LIATAVFVEKRTWEPKVYERELLRDIVSILPKKRHSGRVAALAKGAMGLLVEIVGPYGRNAPDPLILHHECGGF